MINSEIILHDNCPIFDKIILNLVTIRDFSFSNENRVIF